MATQVLVLEYTLTLIICLVQTLYLNEHWHPNAGGWFVWMDHGDLNLDEDPNKTDVYRAVLPEQKYASIE